MGASRHRSLAAKRTAEVAIVGWSRLDRAVPPNGRHVEAHGVGKAARKTLISCSGPGGTLVLDMASGPFAELIVMVLAFAAEFEAQSIQERTIDSQAYLTEDDVLLDLVAKLLQVIARYTSRSQPSDGTTTRCIRASIRILDANCPVAARRCRSGTDAPCSYARTKSRDSPRTWDIARSIVSIYCDNSVAIIVSKDIELCIKVEGAGPECAESSQVSEISPWDIWAAMQETTSS